MSLPLPASSTTADAPRGPVGLARDPARRVPGAPGPRALLVTVAVAAAAALLTLAWPPADLVPAASVTQRPHAALADAPTAARLRVVAGDLADRLATLDAIERAVALRDWQSATGVPARWTPSGPEGDGAFAVAVGPVWVLDDRRVVVAVPRPPGGAAGVDGLVLGPWPAAPADTGTPGPAGVAAGLGAWRVAGLGGAVVLAFAAGCLVGRRRRGLAGVSAPDVPAAASEAPRRSGADGRALPVPSLSSEPGGDVVVLLRREVDRIRRLHADAAGDAGGAIGSAGLQVDFDPWVEQPIDHQPALLRRAVRGLLAQATDRARRVVVLSVRVEAGEAVIDVDDDGPAPAAARPQAFGMPDEPECVFADAVAETHGGRFEVGASPLGGLRRTMRWPVGVVGESGTDDAAVAAAPVPAALPPDVPYDRRDARGSRGRRADDPR